jgi:hypothetical protein
MPRKDPNPGKWDSTGRGRYGNQKPVDLSTTSKSCPRGCGATVMKSNATNEVVDHYKPSTDGTREYCN